MGYIVSRKGYRVEQNQYPKVQENRHHLGVKDKLVLIAHYKPKAFN